MYFTYFGTIVYDDNIIANLSKRVVALEASDPRFIYDTYVVQNGERPDTISNKFYDVPYYHWVILATNGLTIKTWPKSDQRFENYLNSKYEGTPNTVKHYLNSEGVVVPYSYPRSIVDQDGNTLDYYFNGDGLGSVQGNDVYNANFPVYDYNFEVEQNDKKKTIKVLNREFLPEMIDLLRDVLR